jgi:hypothetical protein
MNGVQNYQLILDSRTTGQQSVDQLNRSLTTTGRELATVQQRNEQYTRSAERAITTTAKLGVEIYAASVAAKAAGASLLAMGAAVATHGAQGEALIQTYRGLRLAVAGVQSALAGSAAPLLATGGVLAVGLLAEATGKLVYRQAELVETLTLASAKYQTTFQDTQRLAVASQLAGKQTEFFAQALGKLTSNSGTSGGQSALAELGKDFAAVSSSGRATPEFLAKVTDGIKGIEDPVKRARVAVALFGEETAKSLADSSRSFGANLRAIDEWDATVSSEVAKNVTTFRSDVDALGDSFGGLATQVSLAAKTLKNDFVAAVAGAYTATREFFQNASKNGLGEASLTANQFGVLPAKPGEIIVNPTDAEFGGFLRQDLGGVLGRGRASLFGGAATATSTVAASSLSILNRRASSIEGLRQRRSELESRFRITQGALSATGDAALPDALRGIAAQTLANTDAQITAIDAQIQRLESSAARAKKLQDQIDKLQPGQYVIDGTEPRTVTSSPQGIRRTPSLLRGAQRYAPLGLGTFQINGAEFDAANSQASGLAQSAARGAGDQARIERDRNRELVAIRQSADFQARKVELLAGPGGEIAALRTATQLRIAGLEQEKTLTSDVFALEQQQGQLRLDYELRILELKKAQRNEGRTTATSLFDAAVSGGQGLRSFITSQALAIPRTIAGNLGGELGSLTGRLQIPGLSATSLGGRLLSGTPFGVDPLKGSTDLNTEATVANTQQIAQLSATIGAGRTGSGFSSILSGGGLSATSTITDALGFEMPNISGNPVSPTGVVSTPGASRFSGATRAIGIGGALAAGAFGAYSGFSAGGAQGALTGTASIAGAAAAVLPLLSKSLALAGPIGMVAGAALGLAASLIGNPKEKRGKELAAEAESRRFTDPTGADYVQDLYGRGVGYDYRGNSRPVIINNTYNTKIDAVDAVSLGGLLQRYPDQVAAGVSNAIMSGNGDDMIGNMGMALGVR